MRFVTLIAVMALALVPPTAARAQDRDEAPRLTDPVELRVEVTISRQQGDTLVSSQPYMLSIVAESERTHSARLSAAAEMPVLIEVQAPVANAVGDSASDASRRGEPFNYRNLGIDVECLVRTRGEGQYELTLLISESSVDDADQSSTQTFRATGVPIFRSFESSSTMLLRDGESRQYLAATDRNSGETIRVEVTLTVLD